MTFQDLAGDYRRQMTEDGPRVENKLRLNLSERAYATLLDDMEIFHAKGVERGQRGVSSYMVNRLFHSFCVSAQASVSMVLGRRRAELEHILEPLEPGAWRETAVHLLLDGERERLLCAAEEGREKSCSFSVRLDKESIRYLAEDAQGEGEYYGGSVGRYIKAVLEEYARLPYSARERLYFKESIVDKLPESPGEARVLKLTLRDGDGGRARGDVLYMKPLGLFQGSDLMYNYLAGMARKGEEPWRATAVRLTSIVSCLRLEQRAFLSGDNVRMIEKMIQKSGVQYLSDSQCATRVLVRFTPRGERNYHKMLHLRPRYVEKVGPLLYVFECPSFQAETYFFRLGADAQILEPKELANRVLERHRAAVRQYEGGPG